VETYVQWFDRFVFHGNVALADDDPAVHLSGMLEMWRRRKRRRRQKKKEKKRCQVGV